MAFTFTVPSINPKVSVFDPSSGYTWTNTGIVPPGFPGTTDPTLPATSTPGDTPGQVVTITDPVAPWYKTWWGAGAIAVVGIFAASKLMKRKA